MTPTRRSLLKGLAILPVAGVPLAGVVATAGREHAIRFVIDRRLPDGPALADFARRRGHALADPQGEIVALFLGAKAGWLKEQGMLIGLTGYSEMVLMRDLLRSVGRSMRYAAAFNDGNAPLADRLEGRAAALVTALHAAPPSGPPRRSGSFLWLV